MDFTRSYRRWLGSLAVAALLAACSTSSWLHIEDVPLEHKVRSGETLYQLAFRYKLDPGAMAQWNGVGRDARLYAGQTLRLRPPLPGQLHPVHGRRSSESVAQSKPRPKPRPSKPSSIQPKPTPKPGQPTVAKPQPTKAPSRLANGWQWPLRGEIIRRFGGGSEGIDIAAAVGTDVRAAANGRVVYGGSALKGYGLLLVLEHSDELMSAYAHTAELLVTEGQEVKAGQVIAKTGLGPGQKPMLHFEARRRGQPIDPMSVLRP